MSNVVLFYDSACPLCLHEVRMLSKRNHKNHLRLVDLHNSSELAAYPNIDKAKAMAVLHAIDKNGVIVLGLDATHAAWSAVGLGYVSAPLRWPIFKHVADFFYRLFVSRRYTISKWLTGSSRCTNQACSKSKRQGNG